MSDGKKPPLGCCGGDEVHLAHCQTVHEALDGAVIVEECTTQFDKALPIGAYKDGGLTVGTFLNLREPLAQFASLMEAKLQKNDPKWRGNAWPNTPIPDLMEALDVHLKKLRIALLNNASAEVIAGAAADCANFLMMVSDNTLRDSRK